MLLVIQYGGAIAIGGSNTGADLTSCTLSSNKAKLVREHANQEQCRKHLCMQGSVLSYWCMHVRGEQKRGKITLAVGYSVWGRHRHLGQQRQGSSDIMHTKQQ